jgi:hypothetical protein
VVKTPESDNPNAEGMLPEYRFDYGKAKPNRFATKLRKRRVAVVLDEDVAKAMGRRET